MALILHLTDLHLGSSSDGQVLGDHQFTTLSRGERTDRVKLFHNTLEELAAYLEVKRLTLDAVVLSGDLTIRDSEEGYEELEGLLQCLGRHRPAAGKVLIVPGNH